MADQTQRLEIATVRAEVGSNILFRFANDAVAAGTIPTDSGNIQNLKQVILEIQSDAAEKISIATTIYQTPAAGLAATADGGIFLVQSADANTIYTVWQNQAGAAVNTGKTAMSSQAIEDALTASNEAAQAAEDAADVATSRTAGFLQPAAVPPVTRDDGLPLHEGDRYFNTEDQAEYLYKAEGWTANDSLAAVAEINARFTLDPAPGKTPQADSNGLIIEDWLPATIARQSDLQALIDSIKSLSVNVLDYGVVPGGTLTTPHLQPLIDEVSNTGGGLIYFPRGNFNITGSKFPGNVFPVGAGESATLLSYAGEPGATGIEFTYKATSYNLGGAAHLTLYNTGSFAASAIKTAANIEAFNKSQRWAFQNIAVRGAAGCADNIVIGDCASANIATLFIQGFYVAQNADAGQVQDNGILLKGLRGVVNVNVEAYKMRGLRSGLRVSDYAEGFSIHDGEIVGSWEGIICDSNPSKPGGFIYGNHLNCAYRGIRMERRRHISIGTNQFYRDSSFAAHGLGYGAIEASSCAGLTIGQVQTRIGTGFTDAGVGVILLDTPDVVIEEISGGEIGTLTKALQVSASAAGLAAGVTLKGISGDTVGTWVEFVGPVSRFKLADNVNERGTPSINPIVFTGSGAEKSSIKLPATSTAVPEFSVVANRNAAFTRNIKPRVDAPIIKESLVAGAGAYVGAHYLDTVSAVLGDKCTIILRQIGGSNSTFNIYSGASTGSPTQIKTLPAGAAGANNFRVFHCYFNGTAWEIPDDTASLT
jgi:hypothetical protein